MGREKTYMIKKVSTFLLSFLIILVVILGSIQPLKVEAVLSKITNDKILAVVHKKEGDLDSEITTALTTASMRPENAQLLVISGNVKLNAADWIVVRNRGGLTSLLALYFDGYTAETSVPEGALKGADWITVLKLSNTFTEIGKSAFEDCSKLTEVELLGVRTVGERAFAGNTLLATVLMPEVTEIKDSAFSGAPRLGTLAADRLEVIGNSAFYNNTNLKQINFPSLREIKTSGFENSTGLANLSAPNLRTIGERAFASCSALKQIVLGDGVSVGANAFLNTFANPFVFYKGAKPNNIPANSITMEYEGSVEMPRSQTVNEGSNVTFNINLIPKSGSDFKIISYQWNRDARPITEGTSQSLNVNNVRTADEGNYQVEIKFEQTVPASGGVAATKKEVKYTSIPAILSLPKASLEAITGLPAEYKMKKGDKVTWTPRPTAGTWEYQRASFEMKTLSDGAEFTALIDGKYTITYTAPNKNVHKITVQVGETSSTSSSSGSGSLSSVKPTIPGTGQGFIYIAAAGAAVVAISAGLIVTLRKKK